MKALTDNERQFAEEIFDYATADMWADMLTNATLQSAMNTLMLLSKQKEVPCDLDITPLRHLELLTSCMRTAAGRESF